MMVFSAGIGYQYGEIRHFYQLQEIRRAEGCDASEKDPGRRRHHGERGEGFLG